MDWKKEYFYHYTSFEAAEKIISSRTLLFSEIKKLNDINESCGPTILFPNSSPKDIDLMEDMLGKYKQVSLTMDNKGDRKGFDIPAMWGHYASRGHGVCLVFNKEAFIASINKPILYHRSVIYTPINDLNRIVYDKDNGISFKDFIRSSKDDLFFHKTTDWSYEQEYRVIAISDEIRFLDIKDSLEAVILYNRKHDDFINSVEYKSLSKVGQDLDFYRYTPGIIQSCDLFDVNGNSIKPERYYDLAKTKGASLEE